jgi:hypothetical protein
MNAVRSTGALIGLIAVLLTGCAAAPEPASTADADGTAAIAGVGAGYLCWQTPVERAAVEARAPLSEFTATGAAALAEATWDDGSPLGLENEDQWWIGSDSAEEVIILRELTQADVEGAEAELTDMMGADHELMAIQYIDDASNWEPGWHVMASTRCALTVDLGELTVPRVQLDPSMPPTPDSAVIHLLVTEMECNSGEDAEGRVEVVSIEEGADSISVVLGVKPRDDVNGATCPSNPRTPFAITLSEPLGDRTIVNAALATPSAIEPPIQLGY